MAGSEPSTVEIDQHSSDGIAFKESYQCDDELYALLRITAIQHLRSQDWDDQVDLSKVQLRRFTFEDGVISFDATHPHVTHEDEMEGEIPVSEVEQ